MAPLTVAITDTRIAARLLGTRRRWVVVLLAVFGLALTYAFADRVLAPDTHSPAYHTSYQWFFSAAAEALPTLLVALAVQANLFSSRSTAMIGTVFIVVGEVAAVASLSPDLSPSLALPAFCLTVTAGFVALIAVLFIALKQLAKTPYALAPAEGQDDSQTVLERLDTDAGAAVETRAKSVLRADPRARRPVIEFSSKATEEVRKLRPAGRRLVLRGVQDIFETGAEGEPLVDRPPWRLAKLANVRILYRPLSPDELARHDNAPAGIYVGSIVDRNQEASAIDALRDT